MRERARRDAAGPTILDVAERSGVSKSTVSNVIRGGVHVSPRTGSDACWRRSRSSATGRTRLRGSSSAADEHDRRRRRRPREPVLRRARQAARASGTRARLLDDGLEHRRPCGARGRAVEALLEQRVAGIAMLQFSGDREILDERDRRWNARLRSSARPTRVSTASASMSDAGPRARRPAPGRARPPAHRVRHEPARRGAHEHGAARELPRVPARAARRAALEASVEPDATARRRRERHPRDRADRASSSAVDDVCPTTSPSSASTGSPSARSRASA